MCASVRKLRGEMPLLPARREIVSLFSCAGEETLFRPEPRSMICSNIKSEGTIVNGLAVSIDSSGNGDAALQPGVKARGE